MPRNSESGPPEDELEPEEVQPETQEKEKITDPKEILNLFKEYEVLHAEWEKFREKELKALDDGKKGNYADACEFWDKECPKYLEIGEKMSELQGRVDIDLYAFERMLRKETPEELFKYWVVKPKVEEQKRSAGSINADPKRYEVFELQAGAIEEYLRQSGFDVDEKLLEYDFGSSLDAILKNLEKVYGEDAKDASDYVLIRQESLERN